MLGTPVVITQEQALDVIPNARILRVRQKSGDFYVYCADDRLVTRPSAGAIPVAYYQGQWHRIVPTRDQFDGVRKILLQDILPEVKNYDLVDWINPENPEDKFTFTWEAFYRQEE